MTKFILSGTEHNRNRFFAATQYYQSKNRKMVPVSASWPIGGKWAPNCEVGIETEHPILLEVIAIAADVSLRPYDKASTVEQRLERIERVLDIHDES